MPQPKKTATNLCYSNIKKKNHYIVLILKEQKINCFRKCDRHHETQENYLHKITYCGGKAKKRKKALLCNT